MIEDIRVLGFGSYFTSQRGWRDIDLLIVHRDIQPSSIRLAINVKRCLGEAISAAHIIMLSSDEERELRFVERSCAVYLATLDATAWTRQLARVIKAIEGGHRRA